MPANQRQTIAMTRFAIVIGSIERISAGFCAARQEGVVSLETLSVARGTSERAAYATAVVVGWGTGPFHLRSSHKLSSDPRNHPAPFQSK